MVQHRPALLDPDGRPETAAMVKLPVGVSESEALEVARRVVWPLHRDAVVAERIRHTMAFLTANPDLDRALAELTASQAGRAALEEALEPFCLSYSHRDPVLVPARQEFHDPDAHA